MLLDFKTHVKIHEDHLGNTNDVMLVPYFGFLLMMLDLVFELV